jgi:putative DNA primase/helicase
MTETPVQRFVNALYRATGEKAKGSGKGWQARCPAHDDRRPSLSIAAGEDGRVLVTCHAGCAPESIVAAVSLGLADLMPEGSADVDRNHSHPRKTGFVSMSGPADAKNRRFLTARAAIAELKKRHGKASAMWTYHNAKRELVGVICRWDRPDGTKDIRPVALNGEGWVIGGMPGPRPLYGLAEPAAAKRIFVVEGEKCVEAARSIGLTATTSAGGAKAAAKTDWSPLAGKEVVILPDHDQAGRSYDDAVVALLAKLTPVPVVKVVELRGLPEGGDIHDSLEQRDAHDPEKLHRQVEALADGEMAAADVLKEDPLRANNG